jgi:hypothetical protein
LTLSPNLRTKKATAHHEASKVNNYSIGHMILGVKYADCSPLLTDSPDRGGGVNRVHTLTLIHSVSQNVTHIIVSCESLVEVTLKGIYFSFASYCYLSCSRVILLLVVRAKKYSVPFITWPESKGVKFTQKYLSAFLLLNNT